MNTVKLVTIVTESILESRLVEDLGRLGAKGYTVIDARGSGSRGKRSADWDQNQNIELEVICNEQVASAILDHCQKEYYSNYAMVVWVCDVEVLRPEKF
jgi:nitrogen regulatory protein PII